MSQPSEKSIKGLILHLWSHFQNVWAPNFCDFIQDPTHGDKNPGLRGWLARKPKNWIFFLQSWKWKERGEIAVLRFVSHLKLALLQPGLVAHSVLQNRKRGCRGKPPASPWSSYRHVGVNLFTQEGWAMAGLFVLTEQNPSIFNRLLYFCKWLWKYSIRSGVRCQYYGMDGPDGSIRSTGLNESHLAAICSAPDTFVHTRRGSARRKMPGAVLCQTNAPKAAVNSTSPAASWTFSTNARWGRSSSCDARNCQRPTKKSFDAPEEHERLKTLHPSFNTGNGQWWRVHRCLGCFFFFYS